MPERGYRSLCNGSSVSVEVETGTALMKIGNIKLFTLMPSILSCTVLLACGAAKIKGDAEVEGDECELYMLDVALYNQDIECWDQPSTGFFAIILATFLMRLSTTLN